MESPSRRLRVRRGRRHIDRAGPLFLFMLLCAGFVPSVLGEFDAAQFLKILQAAAVALGESSQSLLAGDQRPEGLGAQPAFCSSPGFEVADSAAAVFDGSFAPRSPASTASHGRAEAFRKKRSRAALFPRAPPASLSTPSDPGHN